MTSRYYRIRWATFVAPWICLFWVPRSRNEARVRCRVCHRRVTTHETGLWVAVILQRQEWLRDRAATANPCGGARYCGDCAYAMFGVNATDIGPLAPTTPWYREGPLITNPRIVTGGSAQAPWYGYRLSPGWRRRRWSRPTWHLLSTSAAGTPSRVWPLTAEWRSHSGSRPSRTTRRTSQRRES